MKKLFITLMLTLTSVLTAFPQITLSQAQLDSLPASARAAIQAEVARTEAKQKLEAVSEYVGLGREIGEAVNGALGAVEDHVLSIAESDLGKTAIFIVCWKLLYKDIIGMVVGLLVLGFLGFGIFRLFKFVRTEEFRRLGPDGQGVMVIVVSIATAILFISAMACIF